MKNIIVLFWGVCTFLLNSFPLNAEEDEPLRHHVILAIDKAGCDGWIGSREVSGTLRDILLSFKDVDYQVYRPIFRTSDYLSVLGFAIDASQHDMSMYATPLKLGDDPIRYETPDELQLSVLLARKWSRLALQKINPGNAPFSLVSVAKPYALLALKDPLLEVNRTFLVLITDHHYNGNDFYDEIVSLIQRQQELKVNSNIDVNKVFQNCYAVEQEYYIRHIKTDTIWANRRYAPQGYVEVYEYLPLQRYFSLGAVINYPTKLVAKRCRGGVYEIELPLTWRNNPHFALKRLDVFGITGNTPSFQTPDNALRLDSLSHVVFRVNREEMVSGIRMRAWVKLKDGVYNATVLTPSLSAPTYFGRDGLNVDIPVEYEDDATVYGIPLLDLFWIPGIESQYLMAKIWEIILPASLLIYLIYYMAAHRTYRPKVKDFTLKRIRK